MRVVAGLRAFILAAFAFLTLSAEAYADKRVALVVGNSTYQNVPQLPNPSRDAASVAQMLRGEARFRLGDLQQAAEITGKHALGPCGRDIGDLVACHLVRDIRVFDAERAAKSAAHLGPRQFPQPEPGDRCEEVSRLKLDPELTQSRTAVVVGHLAIPPRANRPHVM